MAHYAVTGAAGGIGAALCVQLRAAGHIISAFDVAEADGVTALDLMDPHAPARLAALGPFDGLCNAAGLPPRPGNAAQVLGVNFTATRAVTEALVPHLTPGGSIISIASRAGHDWRAGRDQALRLASVPDVSALPAFVDAEGIDPVRAYTLSKEALILWTFARSEAVTAAGLRINTISPAAVDTGILPDFAAAFGDKVARNLARVGRPGRPDEVAQVAAFLLSPASAWIKGTDVAVDGGTQALALADGLALSGML